MLEYYEVLRERVGTPFFRVVGLACRCFKADAQLKTYFWQGVPMEMIESDFQIRSFLEVCIGERALRGTAENL